MSRWPTAERRSAVTERFTLVLGLALALGGAPACKEPPPKVLGGGPGPAAAVPAEPPAPDPRVACPEGATQQRRENEFAPGQVEIWCEDADGRRHGPKKSWWEDGTPASETSFVRGHEDGIDRSWHRNGQLESEGEHRMGVAVGRYRGWHENGKLRSELQLVSDEVVGVGRWWDERGRLERTRNYDEPPTVDQDDPVALEAAQADSVTGAARFRFRTGTESWLVRADGAATNRYVDRFEADHRFDVGGAIEEIWAADLGALHSGAALVAAVWRAPGGPRTTALERVDPFSLVTRWKVTLPFAVRAPVVLGHFMYASGDGHVVKIDTATGAVAWRQAARIELGPPRIERRRVVYPVAFAGALPAGFPREVAVDERTGRVLAPLPR